MKYKKWRYLRMLLFYSFVYNTISLAPGQSPCPPAQVNVYNNHRMYSENTTENTNRLTQSTQTLFSIVPQLFDYAKSFDPQPYKLSMYQWLKKNKYKIIRNSILGWYLTIWVILLSSHYYFNQANSWSGWQSAIPFTELYTRPEQLLKQELIFDIQKRYINRQNPTDFISPLVTFMNRINIEEKYLNCYTTMLSGINRLHLVRLFLINEKKIKEIELRKQRLTFVRQLFLSWAAEYNINQEKAKHGVNCEIKNQVCAEE